MSRAAPERRAPGRRTESGAGGFGDPVVRALAYSSLGLVILFLATVIGVVATGITSPTGPRSAAERDIMLAASQTKGAKGAAATPYIDALIAAGDLPAARVAIAQARSTSPATESAPALDLAEARLASRQGEHEKALALSDKALRGYSSRYDALVAKGGKSAARAKSIGYGADYYNAALVKAAALVELKRFDEAIAAFDIYIAQYPTAADILIDRGNAKAALNDTDGAEKDFRAALRFVPYDEEAKAGLKLIGASK